MRSLILFLMLVVGASKASLAQQSPKESLKNTYEGVLFIDQSESSINILSCDWLNFVFPTVTQTIWNLSYCLDLIGGNILKL